MIDRFPKIYTDPLFFIDKLEKTCYNEEKEKKMNLLASGAWALDVSFFVIIFACVLLGAICGFVKMVCKWAGTVVSIVVAIGFCIAMKNSLEAWFGLTTAIANGIHSQTIADWISVAIAFVALVVLVRLGAWLLGSIASGLVKKNDALRKVDRVFGAILGFLFGFVTVFILLGILRVIPSDTLHNFVSSSVIVGPLFKWDWFTALSSVMKTAEAMA